MGQKKKNVCGMTFCEIVQCSFADRCPLVHIFWTFTAHRKNWVLKWMGLSITQTKALTMMRKENRNCSRPTGSGSFDLQILKYGIILRVFVPGFSRK